MISFLFGIQVAVLALTSAVTNLGRSSIHQLAVNSLLIEFLLWSAQTRDAMGVGHVDFAEKNAMKHDLNAPIALGCKSLAIMAG